MCDTSFKRAAVLILYVCTLQPKSKLSLGGGQTHLRCRQQPLPLPPPQNSARVSLQTRHVANSCKREYTDKCCVRHALCTRWTTSNKCSPRTERSGRKMLLDAEVFFEDGVPRVCRGGQQSCKLSKHLLPQERPAFWITEPCQCAR